MSRSHGPAGSSCVITSAPSIWTFIVADLLGFGLLFGILAADWSNDEALFLASARQLDLNLGFVNTLVLIVSSWSLALAVTSARNSHTRATKRWLSLTVLLGVVFAVIKIREYAERINEGVTPLTNPFFTYYFVLTSVHFLHVIAGLVMLCAMVVWTTRIEQYEPRYLYWLESGALYWHMVDLLWIFLFAIFYLEGRA